MYWPQYEHPDITEIRRTGYPRGHEEPPEYLCPVCGMDCEKVYKDLHDRIVGCERCIEECFAEDEL